MWRRRARNLLINWLTIILSPIWAPLAFIVILFGSTYKFIKEGWDTDDLDNLDDIERDFIDFWLIGDVSMWSNTRQKSIREVKKRFNYSVEKMKAP